MKGKILVATIIILLLAAFLRFHNLNAQSFWNDEGNSARLSERSIQLIIEGTASDIHPPLYYLLLRGWRELVGDSEFGLRSLSAFAGLVVVAGTLALGKISFYYKGTKEQRDQRFVWTAVLLVTFITAVSPPLIYYSQEARMYALLALEATLSTLFLFWWWEAIRQKAEVRSQKKIILLAAGYVLFATAGLYTQYAFPAMIVAQNVVLMILMIKDLRLKNGAQSSIAHLQSLIFPAFVWLAMMLSVFLLYLPWLPIFLGNIGGGPTELPLLTDYLLNVLRWLAFGHTVEADAVVGPLTAVFILIGLGVVLDRGWRTAVWLSALFIPILTAYYVGAFEPQLFKMQLMVISPLAVMGVLVVFASSRGSIPAENKSVTSAKSAEDYFFFGKWRLQYLGLLVFLGLLVGMGVVQSLANLYTNPEYARADYRSMAARIAAENHDNAAIILNAANQWEVFTYYHTEGASVGASVYPLPRAGMSQEKVLEELNHIVDQHERIYVVYWGDGQQDPQRVVESWLDKNTYKATSDWHQDVRFVMYAVPSAPATEIAVPLNQIFGDHIALQGYTLANDELAPGDIVQITLFWQTDAKLDQRYKVFLHLLDENGQLVAQRDSEPGSTLKPTNNWEPGEPTIDNHGVLIPSDLPPGNYTLSLGLYDIEDPNTRLPIQTENGQLDALTLQTIVVTEQ